MAKRPDPIVAFFDLLRGRQTGDGRRIRRGERELRRLGIEVKFLRDQEPCDAPSDRKRN